MSLVANALSQCSGPTSFYQYGSSLGGWPSGTAVYVYFIDGTSNWSGEQSNVCGATGVGDSCTSGAFYNWNSYVGSGLTLTYEGVYSSAPTYPTNYVNVTYGTPGDISGCTDADDACTVPINNPGSPIVQHASITVDNDMIGDSAYLELMVHEIGHTYGAADGSDCYDTAMNPSVRSTSTQYPTCCDEEWLSNVGSGYGSQYCEDGSCSGTAPCLGNQNCDSTTPTCDGGCCVETEGGGGRRL
jgi:hypothetical protein